MVAAIGGEVTPVAKTASFTVATGENYIRCSHASTPIVATLPAATGSGRSIRVLNLGAALTSVIRAGSDLIGGAATLWIPQYATTLLVDAASGVWDVAEFNAVTAPFSHFTLSADAEDLPGSYAYNTIPFDTVVANRGGGWLIAAGVATCVLPGFWTVQGSYRVITETDAFSVVLKNDSPVGGDNCPGVVAGKIYNYSTMFSAAAGDTIKLASGAFLAHDIWASSYLQFTWEGRA
jgi:hypothetical protein